MSDAAQNRDRAYLDLLQRGLVLLRNFANADRGELCRIEAEHLHEVPTLIGASNEQRHLYYIKGTRELYLQSLRKSGEAEYLERVRIWYSEPWRTLAAAAGVELSD
jgi:hypothetical protein